MRIFERLSCSLSIFLVVLYYLSSVEGEVVSTWISGSKTVDTPIASNLPGGRSWTANWQTSDAFWIFGGYGVDTEGNLGNHFVIRFYFFIMWSLQFHQGDCTVKL
jgi:hypothetical protein